MVIKQTYTAVLSNNISIVVNQCYKFDEGFGIEIYEESVLVKSDSFGHNAHSEQIAEEWFQYIVDKLDTRDVGNSQSLEIILGEDIMNLSCYYDEHYNTLSGDYNDILKTIRRSKHV